MKDYFEILGVEPGASEADIRKAYRRMVMEFHPDRNKSPKSASKFRDIQEAYDALKEMRSDDKAELDEYVLSQIERFQSLAIAREMNIKRAVNGAPYQAPSGAWHRFESASQNKAQVFQFPGGKAISDRQAVDSEKVAQKLIEKISGLIRSIRNVTEDFSDQRMREESRRLNRIPESEIGAQ